MVPYEDQTKLQRITGCAVLPDELIAEYKVRQRMAHALGMTGALTVPMLIDLARHCGLGIKPDAPAAGKVDWGKIDANGTVRVEVNQFGTWMPGVFEGRISSGSIGVRLDADPDFVREVRTRPDVLRLAVEHRDLEPAPDDGEVTAAARLLLDAAKPVSEHDKAKPTPARKPRKKAEDKKTPPDGIGDDDVVVDSTDWANSDKCDVWVTTDDDTVDATFIGVHKGDDGDLLIVEVKGEQMHVEPDRVRKC